MPGGSSSGGGHWHSDYWCWPIPGPGILKVMCEWPSKGITMTVTELDGSLIRQASAKAEKLWPDPPDPPADDNSVQVKVF